ncbi:MAG TPA: S53 family peptidase [Candidatus Nitrosotalea sp.]|nr:S53 family peptidase [Candidatus Nitrosotalea sp.]
MGQVDSNPCMMPALEDYATSSMLPSPTNDTVQNNVIPEVQNNQAQLVSPMSQDKVISMQIVLHLRHQEQFTKCLDSINDPKSQNYRHFLNDTTVLTYLPTSSQRLSIMSYLAGHGFQVENSSSQLMLKISAPLHTVENTFGIKMKIYHIPVKSGIDHSTNVQKFGRTIKYGGFFYAADSLPRLPSNFAALVGSIQGLDNYTLVKPLESPCDGPYCPQGIQVGYSMLSLHDAGFNGTGQSVALIDCPGDKNPQDALDMFDTQYGLGSTTLKIVYPGGTPSAYDPGWASETMMDVEAVHTMAPGSTIVLVYVDCSTGGLIQGIDYVTTNHLAPIISNSWGFVCNSGPCSDSELSPSLVSSAHDVLALDESQGMTILFASGDEGATPSGATLGTGFPASDPNVLSVGATDLNLMGCNDTTCASYGSESGAKISGGGYSKYFPEPKWQTLALGPKSGRAVPDVSIIGYTPGFWVYSTSSDKCGSSPFASSGWFGCAGTSLSSPLWAGYLAVVQQVKGDTMLGNVAPELYSIYNTTSYPCSFHGITSGDNVMNGNLGYSAAFGWNPVTGLGTPISDNLTAKLTGGVPCTSSIPEFGSLTSIVLAFAIVVLILVKQFCKVHILK